MRRDRSLIAADLRHSVPADVADHIDSVCRRLDLVIADEPGLAEPMRLAVLLHEESPTRVQALLERERLTGVAPLVTSVIAAFGRLWKLESDREVVDYVRAHGAYLEALLLFELVHEGAPTARMRRVAALGGLASRFETWVRRLDGGSPVLIALEAAPD